MQCNCLINYEEKRMPIVKATGFEKPHQRKLSNIDDSEMEVKQ